MIYEFLKIMVFPYVLYCGGQPCPATTIENVWKNHDFKSITTHDVDIQSL